MELDFTDCLNGRKENRSFLSGPVPATGIEAYSAPCIQYPWLSGRSSQDYLVVSLQYLLKMCLEAAAVGDGRIASPPPAHSAFVSTVNHMNAPLTHSCCACSLTLGIIRYNQNTTSPGIWKRQNFVRTQQNLFSAVACDSTAFLN